MVRVDEADYGPLPEVAEDSPSYKNRGEIRREIANLRDQMREAAKSLEFEKAAEFRDRALRLEDEELRLG